MEREVYNDSTGQWEFYDPWADYSAQTAPGQADFYKRPDEPPQWEWDRRQGEEESGAGGMTPDDIYRGPFEPAGGGGGGGDPYGGGGGVPYTYGGGGGPTSQAPNLRPFSDYWQPFGGMTYGGYPDFKYGDFVDPTAEEAANMPGFKFAVDEGIKRLGNERAARGTYLGGPTLKAIGSWVTDYGMQSYGNLRDQKLSTYNTNRGNAADAWMKNYGVSRDTFDRNYRSAWDTNQSQFQGAQMQFGRDLDLYNSWLNNQQFLINQGNY